MGEKIKISAKNINNLDLDDSHHFSVEDLNDRAESLKYPSLKKPK